MEYEIAVESTGWSGVWSLKKRGKEHTPCKEPSVFVAVIRNWVRVRVTSPCWSLFQVERLSSIGI